MRTEVSILGFLAVTQNFVLFFFFCYFFCKRFHLEIIKLFKKLLCGGNAKIPVE